MERTSIIDKEESTLKDRWMGSETKLPDDDVYQNVCMHLKKNYRISSELVDSIWEYSRLMVYNKKELIVAEGSKMNSFFLVIEGFCACFYYKEDGQESICRFITEGEFCLLPHAFLNEEESLLNIKTMTKSIILCINREHYNYLKSLHTEFRVLIQAILEQSSIENELHYYYLRRYDATERILRALSNPKVQYLQKHIPQCHIASYLNIAPETFSSIKRKLFKKK